MLIAEIGINHFGDFKKAKLLIKSAHESGADLIKSQIFCPICSYKYGSMTIGFYEYITLKAPQYYELVYYARDLGNDLFYSVCDCNKGILKGLNWQKITGNQSRNFCRSGWSDYRLFDTENTIVSIPDGVSLPRLKHAEVLYVSEYLAEQVDLGIINNYQDILRRGVGYSDHTVGIDKCVEAHTKYKCNIIEKHFTLEKNHMISGKPFRDTVHGATPKEFEQLAIKIG